MKSLLDRRRVLATLLLAGVAPQALAAGDAGKADDKKSSGEDDAPLTCGKEVVGEWIIEYDAVSYRIMNNTAPVNWVLQTQAEAIETTGVMLEVQQFRRTSGGYNRPPRVELWINLPAISMANSHGKPYSIFGKALGHSYKRSVGFGSRRNWIDENVFWYPAPGDFNCKIVQETPKLAGGFEKALMHAHDPMRIEIYAPMFSQFNALGLGDIVDSPGLIEAAKVAAKRCRALDAAHAECRMGAPDFLPPEKEGCFLTTATVGALGLKDDCWELTVLRNFRDRVLKPDAAGARLVRSYYDMAPMLVGAINARADAAHVWRRTWAFGVLPAAVAARLGASGLAIWLYRRMVRKLEKLAG